MAPYARVPYLTGLPMDFRNRFRLESLGIFLIALLLFTLGIWDEQPQGFDGRWALFLQEMFRHGASLFPTTYGSLTRTIPAPRRFSVLSLPDCSVRLTTWRISCPPRWPLLEWLR